MCPLLNALAPAKIDTTELTDQELVNQILESGNTDLFAVLYDRYANLIYRKCLSILKSEATAQDMVHDILIKVFLSLPTFQGKSKFSSWVYSISYNKCMDYLRAQKRYRETELDTDEELLGGAEDDEISYREIVAIRSDRLQELMNQMPEVDRMILLMKYQDELSVKEMEESLSLGSSAVKMRLLRARERLLELYKKNYPDD